MNKLKPIIALLTLLLAACASATSEATPQPPTSASFTAAPTRVVVPEGSFQNPVIRADFADPFILQVDDTYYAYATNAAGKNVQSAQSTDLVKWQLLPDAMPSLAKWAKPGGSLVWAPEVIQIGDQFVLYYTARDKASNKQCVGVAVSAKPEGKFKDTNDSAFVCQSAEGGTIDASPFRDGDQLYLYYKNDGNCCGIPTYIYVQALSPDGLSLVGEPTQLIRNNGVWEGHVIEAPTMVKHDDKYYLFFSANNYAGVEYAVGYATCETPLGPCEDAPENPILASQMKQTPFVIGPGHQAILHIGDQDWIFYHAWEVVSGSRRGDRRFMWLDRLNWVDGKPVIQGPTTEPQPNP